MSAGVLEANAAKISERFAALIAAGDIEDPIYSKAIDKWARHLNDDAVEVAYYVHETVRTLAMHGYDRLAERVARAGVAR